MTVITKAVMEDFERVQWTRPFRTPGKFEMRMSRYQLQTAEIQEGRKIIIPDGTKNYIYRIDQILQEMGDEHRGDELITVSGMDVGRFLYKRIVLPPPFTFTTTPTDSHHHINGPAETVMKTLVNAHASQSATDTARRIPGLYTAPDQARGATIRIQARHQSVGAWLEAISNATGIGWEITMDEDGNWEFEIIPGVDHSGDVYFDTTFDSVIGQKWLRSSADRVTWVLVAGQGEGEERKVRRRRWDQIFGGPTVTGFERLEGFMDARDVDDRETGWEEVLDKRADSVISEAGVLDRFEVEVNELGSFIYREHYDLGDIITVRNTLWGVAQQARIVGVTSTLTPDRSYPDRRIELDRHWPELQDRINRALSTDVSDTHHESHKTRHLTGGIDPISPTDIGAASQTSLNTTNTNLTVHTGDSTHFEAGDIKMTTVNPGTGWQFCNGTNGSPDLRLRFPRGINASGDAVGGTGGSDTDTISNHSGTLSHSSEVHSHEVAVFGGGGEQMTAGSQNIATDSDTHAHDSHNLSGMDHDTINTLPKYCMVGYWMKL